MPECVTVTVADIVQLREKGLTEPEFWALLSQAVHFLQSSIFSDKDENEGRIADLVPALSACSIQFSCRGRVVLQPSQSHNSGQLPVTAPEYSHTQLQRGNQDIEKMWVFALGVTLQEAIKIGSNRDIPDKVHDVTNKMIQKDPSARPSMNDLKKEITAYCTNQEPMPFTQIIMDMYREVLGFAPQCLSSPEPNKEKPLREPLSQLIWQKQKTPLRIPTHQISSHRRLKSSERESREDSHVANASPSSPQREKYSLELEAPRSNLLRQNSTKQTPLIEHGHTKDQVHRLISSQSSPLPHQTPPPKSKTTSSVKGCVTVTGQRHPVQRAASRLYSSGGPSVPRKHSASHLVPCVGPEFIVRAQEAPLMVVVGDGKAHRQCLLTVMLLNGKRIQLSTDPKATVAQIFQVVVQVEQLVDNYLLGLCALMDGDFVFLPEDTKLSKAAPPDWSGGSGGDDDGNGSDVAVNNWIIYLRFRYLMPSLRGLMREETKHLLYLQLRRSILDRQILCDEIDLIVLSGVALQAEFGNFNDHEHGASDYFLTEHYIPEPVAVTDELVVSLRTEHASRRGFDSRAAEHLFITLGQRLPGYGQHPHSGVWCRPRTDPAPLVVSICIDGVCLFAWADGQRKLHEMFSWKAIQRLSFDKHYFCIIPYNVGGLEATRYKIRLESNKAFYLFRLASFHHQVFVKLRLELCSLKALSQYLGVPLQDENISFIIENKVNSILEHRNMDRDRRHVLPKSRKGVKMGIGAVRQLDAVSRTSYNMEVAATDVYVVEANSRAFSVDLQESLPASLSEKLAEMSCDGERVIKKVLIHKDRFGSLGIEVTEGSNGSLYVVNILRADNDLAQVSVGDEILDVGGVCVIGRGYSAALAALRTTVTPDDFVQLLLASRVTPATPTDVRHDYLCQLRYDVATESETFSVTELPASMQFRKPPVPQPRLKKMHRQEQQKLFGLERENKNIKRPPERPAVPACLQSNYTSADSHKKSEAQHRRCESLGRIPATATADDTQETGPSSLVDYFLPLPDVTKVFNSSECRTKNDVKMCHSSRSCTESLLSYNAVQWSEIINSPNRLDPQEWKFLQQKESESEEILDIDENFSIRSTPSPQPFQSIPENFFVTSQDSDSSIGNLNFPYVQHDSSNVPAVLISVAEMPLELSLLASDISLLGMVDNIATNKKVTSGDVCSLAEAKSREICEVEAVLTPVKPVNNPLKSVDIDTGTYTIREVFHVRSIASADDDSSLRAMESTHIQEVSSASSSESSINFKKFPGKFQETICVDDYDCDEKEGLLPKLPNIVDCINIKRTGSFSGKTPINEEDIVENNESLPSTHDEEMIEASSLDKHELLPHFKNDQSSTVFFDQLSDDTMAASLSGKNDQATFTEKSQASYGSELTISNVENIQVSNLNHERLPKTITDLPIPNDGSVQSSDKGLPLLINCSYKPIMNHADLLLPSDTRCEKPHSATTEISSSENNNQSLNNEICERLTIDCNKIYVNDKNDPISSPSSNKGANRLANDEIINLTNSETDIETNLLPASGHTLTVCNDSNGVLTPNNLLEPSIIVTKKACFATKNNGALCENIVSESNGHVTKSTTIKNATKRESIYKPATNLMGPRPYHVFLENYTLRAQQQSHKILAHVSSPTFPKDENKEKVDNDTFSEASKDCTLEIDNITNEASFSSHTNPTSRVCKGDEETDQTIQDIQDSNLESVNLLESEEQPEPSMPDEKDLTYFLESKHLHKEIYQPVLCSDQHISIHLRQTVDNPATIANNRIDVIQSSVKDILQLQTCNISETNCCKSRNEFIVDDANQIEEDLKNCESDGEQAVYSVNECRINSRVDPETVMPSDAVHEAVTVGNIPSHTFANSRSSNDVSQSTKIENEKNANASDKNSKDEQFYSESHLVTDATVSDVQITSPKVTITPVTTSLWHSEVVTSYGDEWLDPSDLWLKKMYSPDLKRTQVEDDWSAKKFKKVRFQDAVERIPNTSWDEDDADNDADSAEVTPEGDSRNSSSDSSQNALSQILQPIDVKENQDKGNCHGPAGFPYGCYEETEALVRAERIGRGDDCQAAVAVGVEDAAPAMGEDPRPPVNTSMGSNVSRHSGKGMGRRAHSSGNLSHDAKLRPIVGRFLKPCGSGSMSPCGSLPTHLDGKQMRRRAGTPDPLYRSNNNDGEGLGAAAAAADVGLLLHKAVPTDACLPVGDQGYSSEKSPEESCNGSPLEGTPSSSNLHLDGLPLITQDNVMEVVIEKGARGLGLSVMGGADADGLLRIRRVFPHEPAWRSGVLQSGDVLLDANGTPLTGLTCYEALEVLRSTPNPVHLVICRPSSTDLFEVPNCSINMQQSIPPPLHIPSHSRPQSPCLHLDTSQEPYGEFEITLQKVKGSLGFTLRKEDESVLGHYVRALVREPALSDGRIKPGDKIVTVNGVNISSLSHEQAVQMLRQCEDEVCLLLYRDSAQTPVSALSPTELTQQRPALRQEAVDMLSHLAVRRQSPGEASPRRRRLYRHAATASAVSSASTPNEPSIPKLERPDFLDLERDSAKKHRFHTLRMDEPASLPPIGNSASALIDMTDEQLAIPGFSSHHPLYQSDHSPAFCTHNPLYQSTHSPSPSPAAALSDLESSAPGPQGLLKWKGVVFTPDDADEGRIVDLKDIAPKTVDCPRIGQGETMTVELSKGWNSRLGFSLQGCGTGTVVSAIYADSVAAKDGRLQVGDRVLMINEERTDGMSTNDVIDLLRKIRGGIAIRIFRPADELLNYEMTSPASPEEHVDSALARHLS